MNKDFLDKHEASIVEAACQIAASAATTAAYLGHTPTPEEQRQAANSGIDALMGAMEKLSAQFEQIRSSGQ